MDSSYYLKELDETGPAWEALLRKLLVGAPGKKVLDVGCGSGFLSVLLGQMGYQVKGIDNYPMMIRLCKGTAEAYGLSDRLEFEEGEAAWMVEATDTFDIVVSRYSSFLFQMPEECMRECRRVLKPGGIFLNFDMNWMAPVLNPQVAEEFYQDGCEYASRGGRLTDMYSSVEILEGLQKLPMSNLDRPAWDVEFLKEIGYSEVSADFYPDAGLWNELLSLRYRSIPPFAVRAVK